MAESDVNNNDILLSRLDRISSTARTYPEPWFDVTSTYTPRKMHDVFRWAELFFCAVPEVARIVKDLASYPITHIIYQAKDKNVRKLYRELFDGTLRLRSVLQGVGIDYHLFGNAFLSVWFPSRKFLKCSSCHFEAELEEDKYKYESQKFYLKDCRNCKGKNVRATLSEKKTREKNRVRFIRIAPQDMELVKKPLSGHIRYYYRPDNEIKQGIAKGDYFTLANTPIEVIEACIKNRKVELSDELLYHFKMEAPSLKLSRGGWGYPVILNAMKSIWHIAILRKANEAIAFDHIVPFRGISPAGNNGVDAPGRSIDLNKFQGFVDKEIKQWRRDPNHIMMAPFPVQEFFLGGNGKALLVNQEIELERRRIASTFGYPLELLDGNMQFSGAMPAARLMSNRMLNYMEDIKLALDFFVPKILRYLHMPVNENCVQTAPVKSVDDVQEKQLLMQLYDKRIVSGETLLELFDIDYSEGEEEKMIRQIRRDAKLEAEQIFWQQAGQLKAQSKVMSIQALQGNQLDTVFNGQMIAQQMPGESPTADEIGADEKNQPADVDTEAQNAARRLASMSEQKRSEEVGKLQKQYPSFYQKVQSYMSSEQNAKENEVNMKPMPTQKPPRRQ